MKYWSGVVASFAATFLLDRMFEHLMAQPEVVLAGPAAIPIALAVTAAAAAGGTAYQIHSAESQKREAKKQQEEQKRQYQQQANALAAQQAETDTKQSQDRARQEARRRQMGLSSGGTSRQDTILTQGLGSVGASQGQQKTLLGA